MTGTDYKCDTKMYCSSSQPDWLACYQSENKLFYTFHISDGGVAAEAGAAAPASNIGGGGIEGFIFIVHRTGSSPDIFGQ